MASILKVNEITNTAGSGSVSFPDCGASFNGDVTVSNNLTVVGEVEVQSDERLKSNIVSLGSTLSKLILIDGKSYVKDGKRRICLLYTSPSPRDSFRSRMPSSA